MQFYRKIVFFLFVGILFLLLFFLLVDNNHEFREADKLQVSINGISIPVEVANNENNRRLGLSYREALDKDSGMLFDMQSRRVFSFWMKDMNFPLDIIWIDGNKIVKISKNLPPAGSHPNITYSSEFPIDFVLEVNGGFCNEQGIAIGDTVIFDLE